MPIKWGEEMLKGIFGAALYLTFAGTAVAAPKDGCPTLADGNWVVASVWNHKGINGLSPEEARRYVGKKMSISGDKVAFDGRSCTGAKRSVEFSAGDFDSQPGFPYQVLYECPGGDNSLIPALYVGKSCRQMLMDIESVIFSLRKK